MALVLAAAIGLAGARPAHALMVRIDGVDYNCGLVTWDDQRGGFVYGHCTAVSAGSGGKGPQVSCGKCEPEAGKPGLSIQECRVVDLPGVPKVSKPFFRQCAQ